MEIPKLGIGTYKLRNGICIDIVEKSMQLGYRHIDTARCYRNEKEIGIAIKNSGINRQDIFITTKIAPNEHGEKAYDAVQSSLVNLQTDYIDLVLIHWPGASKHLPSSKDNLRLRKETWVQLTRSKKEGLVRYIGVSNFITSHLEEFASEPDFEIPYLNQTELHPLCSQPELRSYCARHGIIVQAYSSLGQGDARLMKHPVMIDIATQCSITPSEVLLLWALQQNISVIPKTTSYEHLATNLKLISDEGPRLSHSQLDTLNSLNCDVHFCWDPHTVS
jgi:diketogulonate reductase-like aldo/keto reductase